MRNCKLLNRAVGMGMALAILSLPLLSGCVAMASQEHLRMLEEARKAAEAAEADLSACKQKRAELEQTLAENQQYLQARISDRNAVQGALGQ
jgi:hypothetical protein